MSMTTVIPHVDNHFLTRQRAELCDRRASYREQVERHGTCRRPIPAPRLEAVPEATACVACASGSVIRRRHDR